jgi:hypothetical protein
VKKRVVQIMVIGIALFALVPSFTVHAALADFGPIDPANGFPLWYQDVNALALGACLDNNRFCPLPLPGEQFGFNPFLPIVFPGNFPLEFAYFQAEAAIPDVLTSPLRRYELALEAGFFNEALVDNQQIVIVALRIRVDIPVNAPSPADYQIIHPYGVEIFRNIPAGGRILVDTIETGPLPQPLDFATVLGGIVGPFLESANPANADVIDTLTGNIYLMDTRNPLTPGGVPVTGSPFGTNFVQVDRLVTGTTTVDTTIDFVDHFFLFGKKTATLEPAPVALVFPEQNVAPVLAQQTVTVTNASTLQAPAIGDIVAVGPNAADFTIPAGTDDCSGQALGPQETCTFVVNFSGLADGAARTATILIPSEAGEFSPVRVPVSGSIDSIPPVVEATFPLNGGPAPANMRIIAQFDDNLDPLTVNGTTFTVSTTGGPVAGTVTYDDANQIVGFDPAADLELGVVYTATLVGGAGGIADSVGNLLQADFTWTFTGAPPDFVPPFVSSANPANGSGGFPTGASLTVTFDEPMLGFTLNTNTVLLSTAAGPVPGTVEFDLMTDSVVFTPLNPLEFGTEHTLTISGAMDLSGNILSPEFTSVFVTNFRPEAPQLLAPSNQATGVPRPVTLTWTRPQDLDGDALQFRVSICNNASFIGSGVNCQQEILVTASAETVATFQYAGLGMLFGLMAFAFVGGKSRRKLIIAALVAMTLIGSVFFYSCGGGGGGAGGAAQPAGVVSTQVAGLSPGITFFWVVEADDGKGGTSVSDVSTFATQ